MAISSVLRSPLGRSPLKSLGPLAEQIHRRYIGERQDSLVSGSQGMQHALAQEGKASPPVHRPLDEFEFVDVPLDGSIAGGLRHRSDHPISLAEQPFGKLPQFTDPAPLALADPGVEERDR